MMEKMELQQTAEHVIDLEARIINWRGNAAGWMKELSRLGEAIDNLSREALCDKNPVQEAFLKCLRHKTNRCREHVSNRADGVDMRNKANFFSYYETPASEPVDRETELRNDALCVVK
jgi:hypothetical protein